MSVRISRHVIRCLLSSEVNQGTQLTGPQHPLLRCGRNLNGHTHIFVDFLPLASARRHTESLRKPSRKSSDVKQLRICDARQ